MEHYSQTFTFGGAMIEYRSFDLPSVKLTFDADKLSTGGVVVTKVNIAGEEMEYTSRFGVSFATLLGQSPSVFNLFSPDEVIARGIARHKVGDKAVIAIDRTGGRTKALAVSPFTKRHFALPHLEKYMEMLGAAGTLGDYDGDGEFRVTYDVSDRHKPFSFFDLEFSPNMTIRVSVDGWGKPTAWLSLALRSRGVSLRAQSKAFCSSANIGEESGKYVSALARFTRGFSNEEGFGTLATRIEAAHSASASLAEFLEFEKAVTNASVSDVARTRLSRFAYDEASRFGLSSLGVVSKKRLVRAPSNFSVADLIMLGAEIASKEAKGKVDSIYEWIGGLLADDSGFDLEGTLESEGGRTTMESYLAEDAVKPGNVITGRSFPRRKSKGPRKETEAVAAPADGGKKPSDPAESDGTALLREEMGEVPALVDAGSEEPARVPRPPVRMV